MAVSFLDARRAAAKLEIENYETLSPKDKLIAAVSEVLGEDVSAMDSDQLKKAVDQYIENGTTGNSDPEPVEDDEAPAPIEEPEPEAEPEPEPEAEPEPEPVEEKPAPKATRTRSSARTKKQEEDKQTVNIIVKQDTPTPVQEETKGKEEEKPANEEQGIKDVCDCHGSLKPGAIAIYGVAKFLESLSKSLMELNNDLSIGNLSK